ncbi:cyclophilin-like fold protein [Mesorhizobium sp. ORM6]
MIRDAAWLSRRALLVGAPTFGLSSSAHAQTSTTAKGALMRLRFVFADQDFTATLEDNPSAHNLVSLLPLDLTIDDYSTNEKIAYLPRKLTEEGSGHFGNEAVGDLCYYAPGAILRCFTVPIGGRGLIRLGRLDHGPAPLLLLRGEHPLRVETL